MDAMDRVIVLVLVGVGCLVIGVLISLTSNVAFGFLILAFGILFILMSISVWANSRDNQRQNFRGVMF